MLKSLAAAVFALSIVAAPTPGMARVVVDGFAELAETATPAVVNIAAARTGAPAAASISLGSGFVIDPSGTVVTNAHVVANAGEIYINLSDGRTLDAVLVGADAATDLALLQITDEKGNAFPHIAFGDSDEVRPGDWALAIGNPFGLGGSITLGIVSAINRNISAGQYDDFIQTDAAINRGNSGGPLLNLDGDVIGVNSAIFSQTGGSVGVGFAIPANLASFVVSQLLEHGEVRRGWLGVVIEADDRTRAGDGVVVTGVAVDGPAAAAGIAVDDRILEVQNEPIDSVRELQTIVSQMNPGSTVRLTLTRDERRFSRRIEIGRLNAPATGETILPGALNDGAVRGFGLVLQSPTDAVREAFNLADDVEGVVVLAVEPGSPAADILQPGDVILEIGWERLTDPQAAMDRLQKLADLNSGPTQIYVRRGEILFYELLRLGVQ